MGALGQSITAEAMPSEISSVVQSNRIRRRSTSSLKHERPIEGLRNTTIGPYTLIEQIGSGSFGHVYSATKEGSKGQFAIKVESSATAAGFLRHEGRVCCALDGCRGVLQVHDFFETPGKDVMVMDRLGESLKQLRSQQKFSLKTVCMVACEMLTVLEAVHRRGFIHRDVKLSNIMAGGSHMDELWLIDYGLARRYVCQGGAHIPLKTGKNIIGTIWYASLNMHKGLEPSRRDDLESLCYSMMQLTTGALPWQMHPGDISEESAYTMKMKTDSALMGDAFGGMAASAALLGHLTYCRGLAFDEEPDYNFLRQLYTNLIQGSEQSQGQHTGTQSSESSKFDWQKKPDECTYACDEVVESAVLPVGARASLTTKMFGGRSLARMPSLPSVSSDWVTCEMLTVLEADMPAQRAPVEPRGDPVADQKQKDKASGCNCVIC